MGLRETINSVFFGQAADTRIHELEGTIESAKNTLRRLLIEKQRLECAKSEFLTEKDVIGLRKLMKEASLYLFEGRNATRIDANIMNCSIRFHTMHGRYDIGNDDVIYVTRPHYAFQADYMANGTARLRNITEGIHIDEELSETWDLNNYSHPHVSDTYEDAHDFGNICFGANKFVEILSKPTVTPQDYVEFLRRFYIWASHGNLDDMYDRRAYKEPSLTQKAKGFIENIDGLFADAQKYANGNMHNVSFAAEVCSAGLHGTSHAVSAFIRVYAAWLLKNMPKLASVIGHSLPRYSLIAAAKLDLAAYENIDSDAALDVIANEVFAAPRALRKLIEISEPDSQRYERTKAALLSQFIQ